MFRIRSNEIKRINTFLNKIESNQFGTPTGTAPPRPQAYWCSMLDGIQRLYYRPLMGQIGGMLIYASIFVSLPFLVAPVSL